MILEVDKEYLYLGQFVKLIEIQNVDCVQEGVKSVKRLCVIQTRFGSLGK